MTVSQATAAARNQDWPTSLTHALEAWQTHPATDLADLIDRLESLIPKTPYAGEGKTLREAVRNDRPDQIVRIAAQLPLIRRVEAESILRRALTLPPDPRWGQVMKTWLLSPPFLSGHSLWKAVVALIEHTGDARLAPVLASPIGEVMPYELFDTIGRGWDRLQAASQNWLDRSTPDTETLCEFITAAEVEHRERASLKRSLFERFVANPDDAGALAVLADLLQDEDHPQGELIALQTSPHRETAEAQRIKTLIKDYGSAFAGRLAPYVLKRRRRFESGHLHTAVIRFKTFNQVEALGDCTEAAALRVVDLDSAGAQEHTWWELALPLFRGMRVAVGVGQVRDFFTLLTHPTLHTIHTTTANAYASNWALEPRTSHFVLPRDPLERAPERVGHLHTLHLTPQAKDCLAEAVRRGLSIDRLRWCVEPDANLAEQIKYALNHRGPLAPTEVPGLLAATPPAAVKTVEIALGYAKKPIRIDRYTFDGGWRQVEDLA